MIKLDKIYLFLFYGIITGLSGQTVRMSSPATILKPGTQVTSQGGKQQIIVHKATGSGTQPQIVTLVKTSQGVTVATVCINHCFLTHSWEIIITFWNLIYFFQVPKVSLVQSKGATIQAQQVSIIFA